MKGRQIALIRGINVGRAKRVAMADLRAVVESLGYRDVRTVLNSGNIVFTVAGTSRVRPAARIEKAIAARLGISARVVVLTATELAAAVDENPLLGVADDPARLLVTVFGKQEDRTRLDSLAEQEWVPEVLAIGNRVAYLWCASGFLASGLAVAVGRALGDTATSRNWSTMTRLRALAEGQA